MAKLYFKYGAMGSSKSAQALITQFNYEELGMTVWLISLGRRPRRGEHHPLAHRSAARGAGHPPG